MYHTYTIIALINTLVYFFMLSTCADRIVMKQDSFVHKWRLSSGGVWEQQESEEPPV